MGNTSTTGNSKERESRTFSEHQLTSFKKLNFERGIGGLIMLGPTPSPLSGMSALLASPEVIPIATQIDLLHQWSTARDEIISVTRQVSAAIRTGKAAVVYLDMHLGEGVEVSEDAYDFVCARLSRILVGLADPPPYVAIHGQQLATALLTDTLRDSAPTIGTIADYLPVVQLTDCKMFAGTPVAVCSSKRAATAVAHALDWFEARRN